VPEPIFTSSSWVTEPLASLYQALPRARFIRRDLETATNHLADGLKSLSALEHYSQRQNVRARDAASLIDG
jgi:hypothetical protein